MIMMRIVNVIVLFVCCAVIANAQRLSNNPLDVPFGDPYILLDERTDTYYMYGTGGTENGFVAYSSKDLRNWKKEGVVYTAAQEKSWGTKDFWAPEVYHWGDKFYMFY